MAYHLVTTMSVLKEHKACESGLETLRKSLPLTLSDNKEISLLHILQNNGIIHCVWALRALTDSEDALNIGIELAQNAVLRAAEYRSIAEQEPLEHQERWFAISSIKLAEYALSVARKNADFDIISTILTYVALAADHVVGAWKERSMQEQDLLMVLKRRQELL